MNLKRFIVFIVLCFVTGPLWNDSRSADAHRREDPNQPNQRDCKADDGEEAAGTWTTVSQGAKS